MILLLLWTVVQTMFCARFIPCTDIRLGALQLQPLRLLSQDVLRMILTVTAAGINSLQVSRGPPWRFYVFVARWVAAGVGEGNC
jgi:hypothetical protein